MWPSYISSRTSKIWRNNFLKHVTFLMKDWNFVEKTVDIWKIGFIFSNCLGSNRTFCLCFPWYSSIWSNLINCPKRIYSSNHYNLRILIQSSKQGLFPLKEHTHRKYYKYLLKNYLKLVHKSLINRRKSPQTIIDYWQPKTSRCFKPYKHIITIETTFRNILNHRPLSWY